jgi:hypothetical protein
VLERRTAGSMGWVLLAGATLVTLFGIFEVHRATQGTISLMRGPAGSLVFLAAALLLFVLQMSGSLPARLFPPFACILTAVELISFSYGYFGFAAKTEIFPPAPVFDFLAGRGEAGTFRVAKAGYPIPANSGMIYGIEMAEGYDLSTERTRLFTRGLSEMRDDGVFFLADGIAETHDRRFDLLNVRYVVVIMPSPEFDQLARHPGRFASIYEAGSIAVFENRAALPRAFVVPLGGVEVIPDATAQLSRLKDAGFDPQKNVVVSRPPSVVPGNEEHFRGQVGLSEFRNNSSTFQTATSMPSMFVLSQIYYPGWHATIDGREAAIEPIDFALTGLILPAGTHEVRFSFQPRSFRIGAWISLVAICIAGLAAVSRP